MDPSKPVRPDQMLNEYQTRRVRIILTLFEEDLNFALRWLDGNPEQGSLFQRKLVLSDSLRQEARQTVLEGLDEIQRLAQALDFKPEVENAAKSIMGRLNTDWENLSDLRASNLISLGAVHPELGKFLDDYTSQMSDTARKLGNIFMQGPADIRTDIHTSNKQEKEP